MALGFEKDIRPIFKPYVECMKGIKISTGQGSVQVLLDDYDRVKLLHEEIKTAIHGYDPATPTLRPMPPGGPLSDEDIAKFDEWIETGMLP